MHQKPNYATITLARMAPPTAATQWQSGEKTVVVQGFTEHRFDAGVLVFLFEDGSVIAYGAGQWASVEMVFDPNVST
jgi:hypothetical protein